MQFEAGDDENDVESTREGEIKQRRGIGRGKEKGLGAGGSTCTGLLRICNQPITYLRHITARVPGTYFRPFFHISRS
jgi:hypothetical protein